VDVQSGPRPNLDHGRHLHNCGGPKASSSVLTRATYERVPTELPWTACLAAIGSRRSTWPAAAGQCIRACRRSRAR
jgi:hypothetical protein